MLSKTRFVSPILLAFLACPTFAQDQPGDPKTPPVTPPKVEIPAPPPRTQIAATVNGEAIPEIAVYRALTRIHPTMWDKARGEVLSFLIENKLVDQYLERLKITVDEKEVADRIKQVQEEIKKEGQDPEKVFKQLFLTEAELKEQIVGTLRWDKFIDKQVTESTLKTMFEKNTAMFDGSLVKAKHVLVKPKEPSKEAAEQAKAHAEALKKYIEGQVAASIAKLPAGSDKLTIEKERRKAIEEVFAEVAKQRSDCPSKAQGGELGWFPRLGKMVEPFAQTAFALNPFQISEPVMTEFGYHLILPTEQKKGHDVKFEDVKSFVKEVYAEKLREAVLARMQPISKIEIKSAQAK